MGVHRICGDVLLVCCEQLGFSIAARCLFESLDSTATCSNGWSIEKCLIWCLVTKVCSRWVVESLHNEINFLLSDRGEVSLFRELLAIEPIRVFVRGFLLPRVGMNKVDSVLKVIGDPLMVCKLLAINYRDGMGFSCHWPQEVDDCISYILSYLALDLYQKS